MKSCHYLLEIRPSYQFILLGWNLIYHFPDDPDHVVRFVGEESGVVKLAESMLSACWADQA